MRTISPPAKGTAANAERLFSHWVSGRRLVVDVRIIAATPHAAAGAGPSRPIANTIATSDALSSPSLSSTLSHWPSSASASNSTTSRAGCHSSGRENRTAAATVPANNRTSAAQKILVVSLDVDIGTGLAKWHGVGDPP